MATTTIADLSHELTRKIDDCAHGEGTECIALEEEVICHAQALERLRAFHMNWIKSIHSGLAPYNKADEESLKNLIQRLLEKSFPVLERGAQKNEVCFGCAGFGTLAIHCLHFAELLQNWAAPQLSVGPSARVKLSHEQKNVFFARLMNLSKATNGTASRIN